MFLQWYLQVCRDFFSYTLECLQVKTPYYIQLCEENIYSFEKSKSVRCAFFKEIALHCGNNSYVWQKWRAITKCGRWSFIIILKVLKRVKSFIIVVAKLFVYGFFMLLRIKDDISFSLMMDLPFCFYECSWADVSWRPGL